MLIQNNITIFYMLVAPTLRIILGAEQFHAGFSLLMVMVCI